MTTNRKAHLQRKLSLAPVPKPPEGLAERIKTEIPKELRYNSQRERDQLSRWVALSMGVAASVVILVSGAYVSLHLLSKEQEQKQPAAAIARKIEIAPRRSAAPAETPDLAAEPPAPNEDARPAASKPAIKLAQREKKEMERQPESRTDEEPGVTGGVVGGVLAEPLKTQPSAPSVEAANAAKVAQSQKTATRVPETTAPAAAAPPPAAAAAQSAAAMDRAEETAPAEMTTSPISGKKMIREGKNVYDAPATTKMMLLPWKDASSETKIAILKTELERGADREAVIRAAREAGLNDFADSLEKRR